MFLLVQLHEVLTFDNKTYMCLSARVLVYTNVNLQAFDFFVIFFLLTVYSFATAVLQCMSKCVVQQVRVSLSPEVLLSLFTTV